MGIIEKSDKIIILSPPNKKRAVRTFLEILISFIFGIIVFFLFFISSNNFFIQFIMLIMIIFCIIGIIYEFRFILRSLKDRLVEIDGDKLTLYTEKNIKSISLRDVRGIGYLLDWGYGERLGTGWQLLFYSKPVDKPILILSLTEENGFTEEQLNQILKIIQPYIKKYQIKFHRGRYESGIKFVKDL